MAYAKFLAKEIGRGFAHRNGALRASRHTVRGLIWELRVVRGSHA